jgi:hypothetical protein
MRIITQSAESAQDSAFELKTSTKSTTLSNKKTTHHSACAGPQDDAVPLVESVNVPEFTELLCRGIPFLPKIMHKVLGPRRLLSAGVFIILLPPTDF